MKSSEKYYLFGIFLLLILCLIIYLCGCSFGPKEIITKDKCIEEIYFDDIEEIYFDDIEEFYCDVNTDILSIGENNGS